MKKTFVSGASIAVILSLSSAAVAATQDFSFRGNFADDASVASFVFSIGAPSDVTLKSYSYAGGTQADGTVIAAGGLDPILALWDSLGNLIQEYDDGPGSVPADPNTFLQYDTNLLLTGLAAGTYTATIAQYANFAVGSNLSAGFSQSSATFTSAYGCSNGQFCDAGGNNRRNFWAFDVLGVDSAVVDPPSTVPLPAGLPLLLAGLGAIGLLRRRSTKLES